MLGAMRVRTTDIPTVEIPRVPVRLPITPEVSDRIVRNFIGYVTVKHPKLSPGAGFPSAGQ